MNELFRDHPLAALFLFAVVPAFGVVFLMRLFEPPRVKRWRCGYCNFANRWQNDRCWNCGRPL